MMADGQGAFSGSVGPDRREFLKKLAGAAFAVPVVSSFTMSGVDAVFGPVGRNRSLAALPNTSPPKNSDYTTGIGCLTYTPNLATSQTFTDGSRSVLLMVPNMAFSQPTRVCVYRGNLSSLADDVPSGETPVSAYGIVWTNLTNQRPNANTPLSITVTDPDVQSGDPIYSIDSGTPVSEGSASSGQWGDSFTVDPHYVVTRVPEEETPPSTPQTPSTGDATAAADAVTANPATTG